MSLEQRRRRARRLNDPRKSVEKDDADDGIDPADLFLDYSGVVEKANDEEKKRERREAFAKSVGGSGDGINFEKVWKGEREDDPEIEYSYESILTSDEETERERKATAIGEAVAEELVARGFTDANADADPADEDSEDAVKKAKRTVDLVEDVKTDIQSMKRAEELKTLLKNYVADGGDPEDTMDEVFAWYSERYPDATITVEDGSVTVEKAA